MSNYNLTLQSNNTDLQAILNTINELPEAGEQATPVISVNSTGLITATAGAKSSMHQLAFQAAKTITPTTANQTAVSSGYYTGGSVTVKGDSNLVAENIRNGVSIFGVSGNYGDTSVEDSIVTGTLSAYSNDRVTSVGHYAFYRRSNLTSANFPKVTSIGFDAFRSCHSLTSVSFPVATTIGGGAFAWCSNLTSANFPKVTSIGFDAFFCCSSLTSVSFPAATTIGASAFYGCDSLTSASFPKVTSIGVYAFFYCCNLKSLYLTGSSICTLSNSNAFTSTPIGGYSTSAGTYGSIYVPASLLASYKAATNWAYFSSRFVGV